MVVRELITKLGFQVDEEGLKKGEAKAKGFSTSAKLGMLAAASAVVAFGAASVKAAASQELLTAKLTTMLGSQEKANTLWDSVEKLGLSNAVSMEVLEQGTIKLVKAGVASKDIPKVLGMIGDVAMGDSEKMDVLSEAWARMRQTGVVSSRELMQIGKVAGPIYGVLSKQMGVPIEQIKKLGASGKLSVSEIEKAFMTMTGKGGQFYMGMANVNQTFSGLMLIMKNNLEELAESFGNILMPPLKVIMTTVVSLLQGPLGAVLRNVFELLIPIMDFVSALISALGPSFEQIGRILQIVGGLLGKILTGIAPILVPIFGLLNVVLKAVADILEALMPALNVVIDIVMQFLNIFVGVFAGVIGQLIEALVPVIIMLAEELGIILTMLQPILTIMLNIFGKNMQTSMTVFVKVVQFLVTIFKWLYEILFKVINWMLKGLVPIITWLAEKLEAMFGWFSKLFGLTKKMNKDSKDATMDIKKNIAGDQKLTNLNLNNEINVNAPMGGPGTVGLTPSGAGQAVSEAARGIFTMEMKKVLLSAM